MTHRNLSGRMRTLGPRTFGFCWHSVNVMFPTSFRCTCSSETGCIMQKWVGPPRLRALHLRLEVLPSQIAHGTANISEATPTSSISAVCDGPACCGAWFIFRQNAELRRGGGSHCRRRCVRRANRWTTTGERGHHRYLLQRLWIMPACFLSSKLSSFWNIHCSGPRWITLYSKQIAHLGNAGGRWSQLTRLIVRLTSRWGQWGIPLAFRLCCHGQEKQVGEARSAEYSWGAVCLFIYVYIYIYIPFDIFD